MLEARPLRLAYYLDDTRALESLPARAPEITLLAEYLMNQSHRGPVRDFNAPAGQQALQVIKWLYGTETPFSFQNMETLQKGRATPEETGESFLGVTRYNPPKPNRRVRIRMRRN